MTLKDDIISDAAVFLDEEELADSVTHWPSGVEANADAVTAIVEFDSTEKATKAGKRFATSGRLYLSTALTLTTDDVWVINSINYQAVTVSPPEGGLVVVEIKYVNKRHTTITRKIL